MGEAAADVGGDLKDAACDEGKGEPSTVAEELDGEIESHQGEESSEDDRGGKVRIVVVEDDSGV